MSGVALNSRLPTCLLTTGVVGAQFLLLTHVHVQSCTALSAFYKVVQQYNLGDVANSIPHLCADT